MNHINEPGAQADENKRIQPEPENDPMLEQLDRDTWIICSVLVGMAVMLIVASHLSHAAQF